MTTSLANQLNRLRKKVTSGDDGVILKYSVLHDISASKSITFEQAHSDGLAGLNELISQFSPNFEKFKDTLFSKESVSLYRPNMTEVENKKLKREIKHFLFLVSPYLMKPQSHVAIEWLLNRFSMNIYEPELLFYSSLAHHDTKFFARLIMLIDAKSPTSPWHWLTPLQQQGLPLVHDVLVLQCIRSKWGLIVGICQFIVGLAKYLQRSYDSGLSYSCIFSFYSSLVFSILDKYENSFSDFIDKLLPFVFAGLKSQLFVYTEATLIILMKLCSIVTIKQTYIKKITALLLRNPAISLEVKLKIILHLSNTQNMTLDQENIIDYVMLPNWAAIFSYIDNSLDFTPVAKLLFPQLLSIPMCQKTNSLDLEQFYIDLDIFINSHKTIAIQCFFLSSILAFYATAVDSAIHLNYMNVLKKIASTILRDFSSIEGLVTAQLKPEVNNDKIKQFLEGCANENFRNDSIPIVVLSNCNMSQLYKIRTATHLLNSLQDNTDTRVVLQKTESLVALSLDDDLEVVSQLWHNNSLLLSKLFSKDQLQFSIKHALNKIWKNPYTWNKVLVWLVPLFLEEDIANQLREELDKISMSLLMIILKSQLNLKQLESELMENISKLSSISPFFKALSETIKAFDFSSQISDDSEKPTAKNLSKFLFEFIQRSLVSVSFDQIFNVIFNHFQTLENGTEISNFMLSLIGVLFISDTEALAHSPFYFTCVHKICQLLNLLNQANIKIKNNFPIKKDPRLYLDRILCKILSEPPDAYSLFAVNLFWCLNSLITKLPSPSMENFKKTSFLNTLCEIFDLLSKGCCSFHNSTTFNQIYNQLFVSFFNEILVKDVEGLLCSMSYYLTQKVEEFDAGENNLKLKNLYLMSSIEMFSNIISSLNVNLENTPTVKFFFIVLLCSLNHPSINSSVRKSALNLFKILLKRNLKSELSNIIESVIRSEIMIVNDYNFILFVLNKLFKSGESSADTLSCYIQEYICSSETSISLIALKYLLQGKHRPDLLPFLLQLVHLNINRCGIDHSESRKFTARYLELIANHFHCDLPKSCFKDTSFTASIISWSVCEFQIEQTFIASYILNKMDNNFYMSLLPADKLSLVLNWIGTILRCKNQKFSQQLVDALRTFNVDCQIFQSLFVTILTHFDFENPVLALKNEIETTSLKLNTDEYSKVIVVLLDLLQNGNSFTNCQVLVPVLFFLCECFTEYLVSPLKKSIKESVLKLESVDYSTQLCLLAINSLLLKESGSCCASISLDILDIVSLRGIINILRSSENQASLDIALSVLSNSARLFPNLLLDHIMPLFTFMGSYVIKKDNETTLNNICRTIEAVIPSIKEKYEKSNQDSISLQIPDEILQIIFTFTDSFKHVPVHRHRHIFESLVRALGSSRYLGPLVCIVLRHMYSTDLVHLFEFCAHLSSHFSTLDKLNSVHYLLVCLDKIDTTSAVFFTPNVGEGHKRKHSLTDGSDPLNIILKQKIIDYLEFYIVNDKLISDNDSLPLDQSLLSYPMVEAYFNSIANFNMPADPKLSTSLKNVFVKLITYFDSLHFMSSCIKCINSSSKSVHSQIITVLYHWSSTNILIDSEFIGTLNELFTSCINVIFEPYCRINDSASNNTCKQTLLFIKNMVFKMISNPIVTPIFERLLQLCSSTPVLTILATSNWVVCRIFEDLNPDSLIYTSKILTNIISFANTIKNSESLDKKNRKVFLLTLFKCIDVALKKSQNSWHPYLDDILNILSWSVPLTSIVLNQPSLIDSKNTPYSGLDLCVFQGIEYASLNVPTKLLLSNVQNILHLEKSQLSTNHIVLIFIIIMHLKNLSPSLAQNERDSFMSFFKYTIGYRHRCSPVSVFNPQFEAIVIDAYCELSLKLSESIFYEIYHTQFESATRKNSSQPYKEAKLITFYQLTDALFNKMRSVFLLFTPIFLPNLITLLTYFSNNKDYIEESSFELFAVSCKVFKKCFLHEQKSFHSSSMLMSSLNTVIELFKLICHGNDFIDLVIEEQLIPTVGYISFSSKQYDSLSQLIHTLMKNLSHPDEKMRNILILSTTTILNSVSDQATILLPDIAPYLSTAMNDSSILVQNSAKHLYTVIENITGENLSNYM